MADHGRSTEPTGRWTVTAGAAWILEDGLLNVRLKAESVPDLVEQLRKVARGRLSREAPSAADFDCVHRASRMCWEALERGTLSAVDSEDGLVLYQVELSKQVEWVFAILNQVRGALSTAAAPPDAADSYAKSVAAVMQS
jgi:hypothetical protein